MRKTITILLLLAASFLPLFSCSGSFLDPNVNYMRDGGFGPNLKDKGKNPDNGGNPNEGEILTLSGDITINPNVGVTIGTELTAVYSGTEIVVYQWKKDGVNIDVGGNSKTFTPTQAGSYTVTVSADGYHSKISAVVDVSDPSLLNLSGIITIIPNNGVTVGMELTAVYSGNETVNYRWEKDGVIVGGNSSKYTPAEPGNYTVTVSAVGYNPKTSAAVNVLLGEYTILIDMLDNETGDTVTVSPDKGVDGITVTLNYTVANTKHYNQLEFGGVAAHIALVENAGSGTRTYTIHAADSSNGVITITAVFTHTDLEIDHIAFNEHDKGHITKTYGDAPFTNAIAAGHKGTGLITYHSSNTSVATVDSAGTVTILAVGTTVISAEKAADDKYAHAITTYTLTVNPKLGSAEAPFLVSNEDELRKVGTGNDGWTLSAHYRQIASFTMIGDNFTPIGNNSTRFSGSYNGDGFTISGLSITGSISNLGLFGVIGATGIVKNMDVTGSVTQSGSVNTGGIAGQNQGTIENCVFSGTVTGGTTYDKVGGIVGYNIYGTVINSRSNANVSGSSFVGGITGSNYGEIENSYNTGSVTGDEQVGGISGENVFDDVYIKKCYNTGNVTASGSNVGGIVGLNHGEALVDYCYNTGNVSGDDNVGGIAGSNDPFSIVRNCVSLGTKVTSSGNIGRVIGLADGTMAGNKARSDMKIGLSGVEATATGTANNGNGADVNLGSSTTQSSVFNGWDFSIWTLNGGLMISGTSDLPTLKTNTQSPAPTLPVTYVAGTAGDPFLVATEADLRKVGTETTTGGWTVSAHYKQTANITMTGGNFTRIGSGAPKFTGSYNGDGYTITNLTIINNPGDISNVLGLFGYIGAGGTVKNMSVTGAVTVITANSNVGIGVGGIAGYNEGGTIENCSFSGTVNGGSMNNIGGIVGYNEGTVKNSRSAATVSGNMQVGGISGMSGGNIENCYNTGTVDGFRQVGGIAGDTTTFGSGNYIRNCYNTGDVKGTAASITRVGGIVGNNASGCTVQNCVSLGARVTGTSTVGRVAGNSPGSLTNNKAREDMKIGASGSEAIVTGGTASNQNGSDVSLGATLTSVFNGWDNMTTAGWSWNLSGNLTVNGDLPTLKTNTQSPAPTLPAAAGENTLSGNITISPNSGVTTGTQLTATYTGSESVSYQWKKDGTNVGSNSNTFTPTEAGSYTVTVSAAGYTSKTSTPVTVTAGGVSAPEGMVYVSPGTFQRGEKLGSGSGTNQTPVHQVTLTRGFYMARYEVTQEQYAAVMGTNPSNFQAAVDGESGTPGKLPVERVSWFNALVFCNKLSMQEGLNPVYSLNSNTDPSGWGTVPTTTGGWSTMEMDMSKNGYRLPTEAEWEYAAKGGDPTAAGWVGYTFAGSDNVDDVAWHSGNSSAKTHEVGKKAPNALGLYDMSGNVFEWCWDRYAVYTSDPKTDPTGSGNNTRIARGSSVRDTNLANFSSVYRNYSNPQDGAAAYVSYGFRVVRSAQ